MDTRATHLPALNGHPVTSIAHAWALGSEEQFYLWWPVRLVVLLRGGAGRAARTLAVVIVGVVLWRCVLYMGLHVGSAYVYNAFDTRFDNLAVGCLLALTAGTPQAQAIAARLGSSPLAPFVTLALLVVSRAAIGATYHYTVGFTVDAVLVAVFIVQMLQLYRTNLWSWLESPVVRYLGVISYPLYLWHQWGLGAGHHIHLAGPVGEFAAGVLACIALASGSYFVVERPFLALKRRFEPTAAAARPVRPRGVVAGTRQSAANPAVGLWPEACPSDVQRTPLVGNVTYLRIRFPVLPALVGAALLAVACTESLGPGRRALRAPQVAAAVGSGIALDQVNSTMGLSGTILLKGFNSTNPHLGDAIIATFFWVVPPDGGSTITSVTDRLADGTTVGNAYTPVEFVTSGDIAM